jgi:membrane protein required for colicin V production
MPDIETATTATTAVFSTFDVVVIGVLALSTVFAMFRGFFREMFSLAAWGGSSLIAVAAFPHAYPLVAGYVEGEMTAKAAAGLGVFIAAFIVISVVSGVLMGFLERIHIGPLDKALGLAFGVLRGLLVFGISHLVLTRILPADRLPEWFQTAQTRPLIEASSTAIANFLPEYGEHVDQMKGEMEKTLQSGEEHVQAIGADMMQSTLQQFLEASRFSRLPEQDRATLKQMVEAMPASALAEHTQALASQSDTERAQELARLVDRFEQDYRSGRLSGAGAISLRDIDHLKQSLASVSVDDSRGTAAATDSIESFIDKMKSGGGKE